MTQFSRSYRIPASYQNEPEYIAHLEAESLREIGMCLGKQLTLDTNIIVRRTRDERTSHRPGVLPGEPIETETVVTHSLEVRPLPPPGRLAEIANDLARHLTLVETMDEAMWVIIREKLLASYREIATDRFRE